MSDTIVERVLASGLPLLTLHASNDDDMGAADSVVGAGVATGVCVPLHGPGGRLVGELYTTQGTGTLVTLEPQTAPEAAADGGPDAVERSPSSEGVQWTR